MRNYKNIPYYILGSGAISELSGLLEKRRIKNNSKVIFMIDSFFKGKRIEKKLLSKNDDILLFVSTEKELYAEYVDELSDRIKNICRGELPVAIVGMGGGTTMDLAKCVSILLTNSGKAEDYQGWDLVKNPGIFKIGIPTISGTGAETSRTGIFTGMQVKSGINSDYSIFDQIILDTQFLKTVPLNKFIFTAMDCYLHDIELLKGNNNGITKALAEESLSLIREIFLKKMDYEKLMIASYLGGNAMATADGGHICHPVSYGVSLVLGIRHGLSVCLAFNALANYYPKEIREFKKILKKFNITLPKNVTANCTEEQFDRMVEAVLKNEKPLRNSFGENWQKIFTKNKVKEILKRI